MSKNIDELIKMSDNYEKLATASSEHGNKSIDELFAKASDYYNQSLESQAAKEDSKAKVRNRGKVVFPAESSHVKDNKDHFPINDADQARNALAQVAKYTSVPSWYKGTLKALKDAVHKEVEKHYKSIKVSD
jgi:hypothetical protein